MHILHVAKILGVSSKQDRGFISPICQWDYPSLTQERSLFWRAGQMGCLFSKYIQPQRLYPTYLFPCGINFPLKKEIPCCAEDYFTFLKSFRFLSERLLKKNVLLQNTLLMGWYFSSYAATLKQLHKFLAKSKD